MNAIIISCEWTIRHCCDYRLIVIVVTNHHVSVTNHDVNVTYHRVNVTNHHDTSSHVQQSCNELKNEKEQLKVNHWSE